MEYNDTVIYHCINKLSCCKAATTLDNTNTRKKVSSKLFHRTLKLGLFLLDLITIAYMMLNVFITLFTYPIVYLFDCQY